MSTWTGDHLRWEVRPTLRLTDRYRDQAAFERVKPILDAIGDVLRHHPRVTAAHVWMGSTPLSEGITASIVLAQPSTPGEAVDRAISLLAEACVAAGLTTDVIKEVVAEMAEVDPRSL